MQTAFEIERGSWICLCDSQNLMKKITGSRPANSENRGRRIEKYRELLREREWFFKMISVVPAKATDSFLIP